MMNPLCRAIGVAMAAFGGEKTYFCSALALLKVECQESARDIRCRAEGVKAETRE
jgi:hypothetical protein